MRLLKILKSEEKFKKVQNRFLGDNLGNSPGTK